MYDCIIAGAGPAGTSTALFAARSGLKVLLLDRAVFPRDKICGDALSGKCITILDQLNLLDEVSALTGVHLKSILFSAPDTTEVEVPLLAKPGYDKPLGIVVKRLDFDQFMFKKALAEVAETIQGFKVTDVLRENGMVCGVRGFYIQTGQVAEFRAPLIVGADGSNSVIAVKGLGLEKDSRQRAVAVRQYWRAVSGVKDWLELHFSAAVNPGYFWIFPVGEDVYNVGLGMPFGYIRKNNIDLRRKFAEIISQPQFRERFRPAAPIDSLSGWNLPLGSRWQAMHGQGILLTGDAASLIDPFAGEGIGNALFSGKFAARILHQATDEKNYSAASLSAYDGLVKQKLNAELKISTRLQQLGQYQWLLNYVIRRAKHSPEIRSLISGMLNNSVPKNLLTNPLFYLKVLFQ